MSAEYFNTHDQVRLKSIDAVRDIYILLVDDDPLFRRFIEVQFGLLNQILPASDLGSARKVLAHTSPDLVLLDLKLGLENGLDLLPHITSLTPKPTIIVLSAEDSLSSVIRAIERGADDYVVKSENVILDLQIRIPIAVRKVHQVQALESQIRSSLSALPPSISAQSYHEYINHYERTYLEHALVQFKNNVTETAIHLGISRATLFNRMNKLGVTKGPRNITPSQKYKPV